MLWPNEHIYSFLTISEAYVQKQIEVQIIIGMFSDCTVLVVNPDRQKGCDQNMNFMGQCTAIYYIYVRNMCDDVF